MSKVLLLLGLGCWAGAAALGPFDPVAAVGPTAAIARPLALPFLWRAVADAARHGDPAEVYQQARLLLQATPGWVDGHTVFAWRYALDGGATVRSGADRVRADADRLQIALAVLEDARTGCGDREYQVLAAMAWLVELCVRQEPGIAALLPQDPVVLIDGYRAAAQRSAERLGRAGEILAQRLFDLPRLLAVFLRAGDRSRAMELLDEGITRSRRSTDPDIAGDWAETLQNVQRALLGDPAVDRAALRADIRLESLATFLR